MIKQEERELSSGVNVYFRYTNLVGKTLKSAKDVEQQLREEGVLETFQTTQTDVNIEEQKAATDPTQTDGCRSISSQVD